MDCPDGNLSTLQGYYIIFSKILNVTFYANLTVLLLLYKCCTVSSLLKLYQPIPTRGILFAYLELMDILDKKTGAVMIINGILHISPYSLHLFKNTKRSIIVTVMDERRKEIILTAQWSNFLVRLRRIWWKESVRACHSHFRATQDA